MKPYFEEREGAHMLETFRGTRTLRYLWYEQRGLCTRRSSFWTLRGVPEARATSAILHVRRQKNQQANQLANLAIKRPQARLKPQKLRTTAHSC